MVMSKYKHIEYVNIQSQSRRPVDRVSFDLDPDYSTHTGTQPSIIIPTGIQIVPSVYFFITFTLPIPLILFIHLINLLCKNT